jgi:hypothetical protein
MSLRVLIRCGVSLWLVLWLACATQRSASASEAAAPVSKQESELSKSEKEFAEQWDAPKKQAAREAIEEQTPLEASVPSTPRSDDAGRAQATEAFQKVYAEVKHALATKDLDKAMATLGALVAASDAAGPLESQRAEELSVDVALAAKDFAHARKASQRWLTSCGPAGVDACRRRALGAMGRISKAAKSKNDKAKEISDADACLLKAEAGAKAAKTLPECLDSAAALYRRHGDRLMISRAQLARGRILQNDEKTLELAGTRFSEAERACDEERCLDLKRRVLKYAYYWALKKGDLERAARVAIRDMGLAAKQLPPERQTYAWTTEVEQVCALLDKRSGEGTCRKLERQVNERYTFKDFSAGRPASSLSRDQVSAVNGHYGVTLQDCLSAEASKLVPPATAKYQLSWTVLNDGRIGKLRVDRNDRDEGPFGHCLRERMAVWRYPRYSGELQHVEQSFNLSARTR